MRDKILAEQREEAAKKLRIEKEKEAWKKMNQKRRKSSNPMGFEILVAPSSNEDAITIPKQHIDRLATQGMSNDKEQTHEAVGTAAAAAKTEG